MNKKENRQRIISTTITLVVILALLVSSPAQAVTIGISAASSVNEGSDIVIGVKVDLHEDDFLKDDSNLTITLTNTDEYDNYTCTFSLDGTEITACSGVSIDADTSNLGAHSQRSYAYLYGYGYSYSTQLYNTTGTNYTAGNSWGYGYSSGVGNGAYSTSLGASAELMYNITWSAPGVSSDTDYTADITMTVSDGTSKVRYETLSTDTITVSNTGGGGSGSGSSSTNRSSNAPIIIHTNDKEPGKPDSTPTPGGPKSKALAKEEVAALLQSGDLNVLFERLPFGLDQEREVIVGKGNGNPGSQHHARVRTLHYSENPSERYCVVEISSDPQEVTLHEGESMTVDSDGDGNYDLVVTAEEITAEDAKLTFRELSTTAGTALATGKAVADIVAANQPTETPTEEPVTEPADTTTNNGAMMDSTTDEPKSKSGAIIFVIILVIVVGALLLYLVYQKPKKPEYAS